METDSRFYKRQQRRDFQKAQESGDSSGLRMTSFNYDAVGVALEVARNKMQALNYDIVRASMDLAASTRTIYDYDAASEAHSIVDSVLPDTVVEAQAEDVASAAWSESVRRKNSRPTY